MQKFVHIRMYSFKKNGNKFILAPHRFSDLRKFGDAKTNGLRRDVFIL